MLPDKLKVNQSILQIPLKAPGPPISKFIRHTRQLLRLMFSPHYRTYQSMQKLAQENYSSSQGAKFWKDISLYNLEEYENRAIAETLGQKKNIRILVVGCGAGREVFGLEGLGHQVDGMDFSKPLLEHAQDNAQELESSAHFYSELNINKQYELIFFSNVILNLIPGHQNRLKFLMASKKLLSSSGDMIFFIDQHSMGKKERFYWLSQILRMRSFLGLAQWEKGDTVSAWLTNRQESDQQLYYHYFANDKEIKELLQEAGIKAERKWGIFWPAKLDCS